MQTESGEWRTYVMRPQQFLPPVVSAASAGEVLHALEQTNGLLGQSYVVLSGPEGSMNSWYMGVAPLSAPRYVVVVVLEGVDDGAVAAAIGTTLLQNIMAEP